MNRPRILSSGLLTLCVLLAALVGRSAYGAGYPNDSIRFIVGWPAGGASDVIARIVAEPLSQRLGQSVVVDNRPGNASNIGAELAAKSKPDGYTIYLATTSFGTNASLYTNLPFDPVKDFTAVAIVAKAPFTLVVNNSVPVHTVQQLIDLAKKEPGKLNYASHGLGSTAFLSAELFKTMTGVDMTMVPYKGGTPAKTGLLSNEVQVMFDSALTTLPLGKAGKLRVLATTTAHRSPVAPDIPTIAETVPGYVVETWFAVLAPAGTPPDIVEKLNTEINAVLEMPKTKERIGRVGGQIVAVSPAEAETFVKAQIAKWAKVVKASGVHIQ